MGAKIIHGQATEWERSKEKKKKKIPQITKQIGLHWIYSCPDLAVQAIHKLQHKGVY